MSWTHLGVGLRAPRAADCRVRFRRYRYRCAWDGRERDCVGDVVSTGAKQEDEEEMAAMHMPAGASSRRRLGLLLLLVGLALAGGGLFLPWLRIDDGPLSLVREPATDGLFLICWPMWLMVLIPTLLTAMVEVRRAPRPTAAPVLLLAGALLVMQAIGLMSNGFTGFSTARLVLTYTLLPGVAVSLLGTLLVAVGGWLRYHPRRIATSPLLAERPSER